MNAPNIEINLYGDWITYVRYELKNFGCDVKDIIEDRDIAHMFLNIQKRLIYPIARKILKSQEFSCPPELQRGIAKVERVLRRGNDLTPYLSRKILDPNYNDPLLNHWGIHHIHLGSAIASDGFVERTGPVLFCRFDDDNAYFINVMRHGSWTKQHMIRVLHSNWPESLDQYRLKGIIGPQSPVTDEDVGELRRANINPLVTVEEGVVYAPPGMGVASSGIGIGVIMQAIKYKKFLQAIERVIIDNIERIASLARARGYDFPNHPHFRLEKIDGEFSVVEINCRLLVETPLNRERRDDEAKTAR